MSMSESCLTCKRSLISASESTCASVASTFLMVRRVAHGIRAGKPRVVCSRTDKGERAGNQVLRKCNPLRADAPCHWAEQKVVVNQGRAMADLNKNVFAKAQLCADFPPAQRLIVVKCIARHARSLRLPVQPQSACTMVNVIMRNDGVNYYREADGCMQVEKTSTLGKRTAPSRGEGNQALDKFYRSL